MVLVGALNVGQMTLIFEPNLQTNVKDAKLKIYEYEEPQELKKGDELGMFKMGSTVVMIFEEGSVEIKTEVGKKVRFGEEVATKCS
jgi:phosphatidylserine decarboxylase